MKRWSCSVVVLMALMLVSGVGMAGTESGPGASGLRVMTFNVRYPAAHDGINAWPKRRDLMVRTIREQHPDILGTQELFTSQGNYLKQHLPGYTWFGMGRNGNELEKDDNEHMGVFYNTARLKLLKSGNFWYSDTPDVPGSMSFGQPMPRMVTWAEFQDRASGHRFYYYDTHMPYRKGKGPEAIRKRCAEELLQHLARLPDALPFVLTGDFNSLPGSATYTTLTRTLHDAWASAPAHEGPALTFHGFTGHPSKRIDWILYRGLKVDRVRTVTTHRGNVYPSDHFPVVADFDW